MKEQEALSGMRGSGGLRVKITKLNKSIIYDGKRQRSEKEFENRKEGAEGVLWHGSKAYPFLSKPKKETFWIHHDGGTVAHYIAEEFEFI